MIHSPNLHQLFILTWSTDTTWWFLSLTYISRLSDHVQEKMVQSILQYLLVLHFSNLHQLFIMTCSTDITWGMCPWPTFHPWVTIVRKKWLSIYYSTSWCYIHRTCTNCSRWHDLLIPRGGLCLWHTFHAWVTMVRKKWLSLYYSTCLCYIHQIWTNCSSWHDLMMPHGGLCPWPTFHASVTMVRKK